MKRTRKIISIILVMIMMLSIMPFGGLTVLMSSALNSSGKCGRNVCWTFDEASGTLAITGTGDMYDYDIYSKGSPLCDNSSIKTVVIESGVKSIGDAVFLDCTGIASVTIPESVTSVKYNAFQGCTGLASITLPDSVVSIGEDAFYNTGYYNDSSNWENNVLYIGKHLIRANPSGDYIIKPGTTDIACCAFEDSVKFTSITIPDSVMSIGPHAFRASCIQSITIPGSVTSIEEGTFYGSGLKSITIPGNVSRIGDSAFYSCSALESVTIPRSVTRIDHGAFSSCGKLKDVYYLGTQSDWEAITIGSSNKDLLNAEIHFVSPHALEDALANVPEVVTCFSDESVEAL